MKRLLWAAFLAAGFPLVATAPAVGAEIVLYESATAGQLGIPRDDVEQQIVLGVNVTSAVFQGARFELLSPVVTSRIGGHFVARTGVGEQTVFGAIVALDGAGDFPDSEDLSTTDVLGIAEIAVGDPSADYFGDISLGLEPGWYGLVFGGGLFGTSSDAGAPLNNVDIDDPNYMGYVRGFGWGPRKTQSGLRVALLGRVVPEPLAFVVVTSCLCCCATRR